MGYFAIYVLVAIIIFMIASCLNYYSFYRKHTIEEYIEYDLLDDVAMMIIASVLWPLTVGLILLYFLYTFCLKQLVKVLDRFFGEDKK